MHLKIDYVEFQTPDMEQSKTFFSKAFEWQYQDYGPDYAEIQNAGLTGGLEAQTGDVISAPLVILKTDDLETALAHVEAAGGTVVRPIFSFPGGRRFQFKEPGGNELAVWSET